MDPQLEEYRRKQRERAAAAQAQQSSSIGSSWKWVLAAGVVIAALVVSVQSSQELSDGHGDDAKCPIPRGVGVCVEECSDHSECPAGKLCCSNGCGHVCMDPEGAAGKEVDAQKCTLMAVLKGNAEHAGETVLAAVPKPLESSILKAVGIASLTYATGGECCDAQKRLQDLPEVDGVEFDGPAPDCGPDSSSHDPQEAGRRNLGGWAGAQSIDEDSLGVWKQVLAKFPRHEEHDLEAFGEPVSVSQQVVAGINYRFQFNNGASVTVFHQSWTDTLEVSGVEL
eukprot:TRINITY_DN23882_c0_g1_i1.p1 TRINITY_DN23882_c0_g1~~TRINITY_DN23882_c0_g1_i1.p1  ORF type:complete len:282 (-),score=65.04 TRINITY_DN23882_c0_g1_i1:92-937(-)